MNCKSDPQIFSFKIILLLILAGFFTFSCTSPGDNQASFTIKGTLSNCAGEKILLQEMDINKIIPLDSAIVDPSGKFEFRRDIDQDGFYFLRFPNSKKILLQLGKNENLVLHGNCQGNVSDFEIDGSPGSMLLTTFFKATNLNKRKIDSLQILVKENENSPDMPAFMNEIDVQFQQIADDQKSLELEFLKKNPASLANLIILNYSFGGRPILEIEQDFPVYQWVDSCLHVSNPGNKHAAYHRKRVAEFKRQQSLLKIKQN